MRDNEYFMKTVLATEPWRNSHDLVPLPWREFALPEKLTIGFILDDGVVKPHPPVTSALQNMKHRLGALPQFNVVDFVPYEHARGYDLVRQLYFPDGGKENGELMRQTGEPVPPLSESVMKDSHVKERKNSELWDLNVKRETYRGENSRLFHHSFFSFYFLST
jgi:amidase